MLRYIVFFLSTSPAGQNWRMETSDHILIVDDDAEIRHLLSAYLQKNGLRVTAVGDGKAMERALLASGVDLIVLDLIAR